MPVQLENKAAMRHRLDLQKYEGAIRQDPAHYITCVVMDERKPYTITFDPKLLPQKMEKYGDKLIVPTKPKKKK